ncbi:hypothetical protein KAF80_28885, partial [Bacillus sp. WL1]
SDPDRIIQSSYDRIVYKEKLEIDAFTEITLQIPLLLIFWPLLKVSSIIGIGHKIYAFIAKNRFIIPVGKCTEESCRIK